MFRALFVALCLLVLSACETGLTGPESELVRIANERNACGDQPLYSNAITCSLFIAMSDGEMLRLAELRNGVPFVEREFVSTHLERYRQPDHAHALRFVGPDELEYTSLWYRFIGAEEPATEEEGIDN